MLGTASPKPGWHWLLQNMAGEHLIGQASVHCQSLPHAILSGRLSHVYVQDV